MTMMYRQMASEIKHLEDEIRRIKSILLGHSSGSSVSSGGIVGSIPPEQGGSGVVGSPLGITAWENGSGGALTQGTVVVENGALTFTTTTTVGNNRVIGVLDDDSVADGGVGRIRHIGRQSVVSVVGAVAIGDYLRTSATAGRAESTGSDRLKGTFARALTAFAGPGNGEVAAFLGPADLFDFLQEVTTKGDILVAPGAGDLDRFAAGSDGSLIYYLAANALGLATLSPGAEGEYLRIISGLPEWGEAETVIHEFYIPFGSETATGHEFINSSGVTAYIQFGTVQRIVNPDSYELGSQRILLEVILKSSTSGPARARLWDITDGAAVPNSDVVTTLTTPQLLRSNLLTLDSADHRYRVEFGGDDGVTSVCFDAVLHIGDELMDVGAADYANLIMMM